MKYLGYPLGFLFLVIFLCGCKENNQPAIAKLHEIYNLCENHPASALSKLKRFEKESLDNTKETVAYYDLVYVRTLDKNNVWHTTDSVIKRAWDFYGSRNDDTLKAVCAYYMARVYNNMYDSPRALEYLLLAEQAINKLPQNTAARINSAIRWTFYINSQLSSLYRRHDQNRLALETEKKAVELIPYIEESIDSIWAFLDLGDTYGTNLERDSAAYFYNKALKLISGHNLWERYNEQVGYVLYDYLLWHWEAKADALADTLLKKVPSSKRSSSTTGTLGDYFYSRGDKDIAERYIKNAYRQTNDLRDSISMAMSLMLLYNDGAHNDSLRKYVGEFLDIQARHDAKAREEALVKRSSLYKYYQDKAEEERLRSLALERLNNLYKLCALFLVVCICGILFGRRTYRRLQTVIKRRTAEVREEAEKNNRLEETLTGKEKKIKSLSASLSRTRREARQQKLLKRITAEVASEVRRKFEAAASTGRRENLTEEDWTALLEANKNELLPLVKETADGLPCGVPPDIPARVLILKLLGFSFTGIANITGLPRTTVYRLYKKAR
ncbi:MAG: hypothetical protein J6M53_04635 [Bacteroidaceae bacterium]|nr:hypothetical protein [Bacteroidaceae bacterium]